MHKLSGEVDKLSGEIDKTGTYTLPLFKFTNRVIYKINLNIKT